MKDDEIIVRIELSKPATKKDLKVTFGAKSLKVEVFGETIIDGKLAGNFTATSQRGASSRRAPSCRFSSAATSNRWPSLLEDSD